MNQIKSEIRLTIHSEFVSKGIAEADLDPNHELWWGLTIIITGEICRNVFSQVLDEIIEDLKGYPQ